MYGCLTGWHGMGSSGLGAGREVWKTEDRGWERDTTRLLLLRCAEGRSIIMCSKKRRRFTESHSLNNLKPEQRHIWICGD